MEKKEEVIKIINNEQEKRTDKNKYTVRRHYNNKYTFEELIGLIIKAHS